MAVMHAEMLNMRAFAESLFLTVKVLSGCNGYWVAHSSILHVGGLPSTAVSGRIEYADFRLWQLLIDRNEVCCR